MQFSNKLLSTMPIVFFLMGKNKNWRRQICHAVLRLQYTEERENCLSLRLSNLQDYSLKPASSTVSVTDSGTLHRLNRTRHNAKEQLYRGTVPYRPASTITDCRSQRAELEISTAITRVFVYQFDTLFLEDPRDKYTPRIEHRPLK